MKWAFFFIYIFFIPSFWEEGLGNLWFNEEAVINKYNH